MTPVPSTLQVTLIGIISMTTSLIQTLSVVVHSCMDRAGSPFLFQITFIVLDAKFEASSENMSLTQAGYGIKSLMTAHLVTPTIVLLTGDTVTT